MGLIFYFVISLLLLSGVAYRWGYFTGVLVGIYSNPIRG